MSVLASLESATPANKPDLFLVSRQDLPNMWGYFLGFMEDQDNGIMNLYWPEELYTELLCSPTLYLWLALDKGKLEGALLVSFSQERESRSCWIQAVNTAHFFKYKDCLKKVEHWAQLMGATGMVMEGRKGFARPMAQLGYTQETVILRKNLTKVYGH